MAKLQIVCPSGLSGSIHGLKVEQADALASATRRKRHDVIYEVLSACWDETADPGPYKFDGKPSWDSVLQGDVTYILLKVREATHGSDYDFKTQCAEEYCRERFVWGVDLNDLPIQKLSPGSREKFANGNRFDTEIDGLSYTFELPTGAMAKKAAKQQRNNRGSVMSLAVRMRTKEIEGVQSGDMRKHVAEMGVAEMMELIAAFDEPDCGVDTDIEIECPECGAIREVALPFEGEFFFPKAKAPKRKNSGDIPQI